MVNGLDQVSLTFEDITPAEQRERMIETIAMLDGAAMAMSAPHLSATDLAEIRDLHHTIDSLSASPRISSGSEAELTHACDLLHGALVARCPNRRLRDLVDEELTLLHAVDAEPSRSHDDWRTVVREHRSLLALVQARGDAATFTLALRRHRQLCH